MSGTNKDIFDNDDLNKIKNINTGDVNDNNEDANKITILNKKLIKKY